MTNRHLGANGPEVFPLGLGCTGMSGVYGATEEEESIATVQSAIDQGVNLLDTGDFYGMGTTRSFPFPEPTHASNSTKRWARWL
jgi:aryl-alcohol dehydrogenase-like predicted oxidoreductase